MTPASSLFFSLYPSVQKPVQSKLPASPCITPASSQQLAEGPNVIAMKRRQCVWLQPPLALLCQRQTPCPQYCPSRHTKAPCSESRREQQWSGHPLAHQEEADPAEDTSFGHQTDGIKCGWQYSVHIVLFFKSATTVIWTPGMSLRSCMQTY